MKNSGPQALGIFLLEDEPSLSQALCSALSEMTQHLLTASTLEEARRIVASQDFAKVQIAILDRNLPDGDGLSLCQNLRSSGWQGAILMLTAAGDTQDKVEGLKSGADDYLSKPFDWQELEARIEVLTRRSFPQAKGPVMLWSCDRHQSRLRGPDGLDVKLTGLELKLMERFLKSPGEVLSKKTLLEEVWGLRWLPNTRTVDFFIGKLRKLIESDPSNPRFLHTMRGRGYRFDPQGAQEASSSLQDSDTSP